MYHGTQMSMEEALSLEDAAINYDSLYKMRCTAEAILAAGLTPALLAHRGVNSARHLTSLGFDAIHLRNETFCRQTIAVIAAEDIRTHFIQTAGDAVSIAGTPAQRLLGMQCADLLGVCVAQPAEAEQVLRLIAEYKGPDCVLEGVSSECLLSTCIGAKALRRCGLTLAHVVRATSMTTNQLAMQGFELAL